MCLGHAPLDSHTVMGDQANPSFSFVVATRNRAAMLRTCLTSLVRQDLAGLDAEVIIVDDHSTDDTPAVAAEFAGRSATAVRVIENAGNHQNAGRNTGLSAAGGDWTVFLDDDEFVAPDYATTLALLVRTHREFCAFGGPYLRDRGPNTHLCRRCEITAKR